MGEITKFPGTEEGGPVAYDDGVPMYDVRRVLDCAIDNDLQEVLVVGWYPDGSIFACSSNHKTGDMLHLLELFKHKLMSGDFNDE